jgi:DNA repair protein RadC
MRTRRTKNQIEKDNYNKDVDAYNFYVVNLDTKRAETGFEYREDAVDLLNDYDDKKKYKVVSKRALKMMGIENPNESFKYETGGDFQSGVYIKGGSIKKEIAFKIQNDYIGRLDLGFYNIPLADDFVAYNSFYTLSNSLDELFNYLKTDDGIAMCKYNPKSNFSIIKQYASGKKDYRGDNEIIDKTVFKISAKEVDNLRSIRRLEDGGYFDGSIPQVSSYMTNYAEGGSLEAHGIKEGDTFIKTVSGVIQKVKDKDGKIVYVNLATGERDTQPLLPFENGGGVEDNEVQYITYKDEEIMYEPNYSEYFVNDEQFNSLQEAKDYIDNGSRMSNKTINAYRKGAFEMGGYTDLSKSKPEVINERKQSKYDVQIPEIDIEKIKTVYLDIPNNKILSLDDSIRILKQIYNKGTIKAYEEVKILFLDNSNQVIGIYNHSKGGITGTVIDIEMVCALALKCLAKGVIMSHNHPSGNLKFSDADIKVTRELKNALNLFRISLLDSIVITENGFTSMTNEGILANGGSLSKFENGGNFEKSFNVFYTTKSGRLMVALKVMAKTENEAKEKIVKQMRSSSTFDKVVTVSNSYENGGGIGMEEDIDMSDDNRLRVGKPAMPNKKLSNLELAEKHNALAYEFMEEKKAFGGSLFSRAKMMQKPIKYPNLEDKNVTLKNGKMVKVFSQSGSTLSVIEFGKIGSGVQPTKIDISEIEPSSY